MKQNRYYQRGVSADKEDVHSAIKNLDKGLFPYAFCKVVPDHLCNDKDYCLIICRWSLELSLRYTCIGKKPEIYQYGKELLKTLW